MVTILMELSHFDSSLPWCHIFFFYWKKVLKKLQSITSYMLVQHSIVAHLGEYDVAFVLGNHVVTDLEKIKKMTSVLMLAKPWSLYHAVSSWVVPRSFIILFIKHLVVIMSSTSYLCSKLAYKILSNRKSKIKKKAANMFTYMNLEQVSHGS